MAVEIFEGLCAFRADHADHGICFTHDAAGSPLRQAGATLISSVTPPYGTYCVQQVADTSPFDCRFVISPKNPGAAPSSGTKPISRILFSHAANGNPSTDMWLVRADLQSAVGYFTGTNPLWGIKRTTTGKLALYTPTAGTLTVKATGTTTLDSDSTFDNIEVINGKCGATNGHVVVRINGTTEINYEHVGDNFTRMATNLTFGDNAASSYGIKMYLHHIYGAYEDGDNDLLKPTIRTLIPNGEGNYDQWTGVGDATDNYKNWDDVTGAAVPDTATYNHEDVAGEQQTSTYTNLVANDVPYFVRVEAWQWIENTKIAARVLVRENATDLLIVFVAPTAASTWLNLVSLQTIANVAPDAAAWTLAKVDAMEIGMEFRTAVFGAPDYRVSAMLAEVAVNANESNYAVMPACPATGQQIMVVT